MSKDLVNKKKILKRKVVEPTTDEQEEPHEDSQMRLEEHEKKPEEVAKKPKEEPQKDVKLFNVFYSNKHYNEDPCAPHTLIVADNNGHAGELLFRDLRQKYGSAKERMLGSSSIFACPLDSPGVAVLSIGLGELPKRKEVRLPHIVNYKSKAIHSSEWKLYYCNTHYTSSVTPAASIMIAKDPDEAALFLLQALGEIGAKDNDDMMIYPVDRTTASVYLLCPDTEEPTSYGTEYPDYSYHAEESFMSTPHQTFSIYG
jgi:hypothetical protein